MASPQVNGDPTMNRVQYLLYMWLYNLCFQLPNVLHQN